VHIKREESTHTTIFATRSIMPFYFALPRNGFTSVQGRQETGRTDYVRTAPTSLTFTSVAPSYRNQSFLRQNLHAIALSAIAGEKAGMFTKAFRVDTPARLLYPSIPATKTVRISLPKMSFRFPELSDAQENRLIELNLEERNIKGKGRIWVGQLDSREAAEVVSFGTVSDYASMGGTVSVRGVSALNSILRIITLGAQTLTLANDTASETGTGVIEYGGGSPPTVCGSEFQCADLVEINKVNMEKGVVLRNGRPASSILARQPLPYISGSIGDLSENISHGIFCPFEPNYSQTDRRAINVLLSDFSCLCTDLDNFEDFDSDLVEMWTKEICLTMEGEFVAHMIACLSLAKRIGARVHFVVSGTLYEGTILHSAEELSFKLVGGITYKSLDALSLAEDVTRYAFHSSTLAEILAEIGVGPEEASQNEIKSMRELRSIVMGKLGQSVPPQIEASIGRKLLFLNFREKQESVNPSTLMKFISYIHPSTPSVIPGNAYLDRRAFFSQDATVVALSMFGLYAPSPIISGQSMLLAVPPGSNKTISKEPNNIQFAKKELLVSAKDWDGFARGGAIVQPSTKIKRGVRFSGVEKTEIWGQLVGFAGAGLATKRNDAKTLKRDRDTEVGERSNGGAGSTATKKAVSSKVIDFSMFG